MYLRNTEYRHIGRWPVRLKHASGRSLDAERGLLMVPSCRKHDESLAMALSYVRVLAGQNRGLPPLVVLAGGPGAPAISSFETGFFEHVERFSEICDVVTFDQRGANSALPSLDSPVPPRYDFDTVLTRETFLDVQRASARALSTYWRERGVDPNDYNTIESAHDVNDLRRALDVPMINLHGASYGSHLGLTVLKLHRDHVERAILCIVEGLDDTHKLPANTDRHFHHLSELARTDRNLKGEFPDLVAEMAEVLDTFERNPQMVKFANQDTRTPAGKFAVQIVIGNALGSIRSIRELPSFVRQLAKGDVATLSRRVERWLTGAGIHGMQLAMDYTSGASAERLRLIEAQRREALLDDSFNLPFPFVGDALGVDDLGDDFRAPVRSDVPTLFCAGSLDGRTPVANAEAARQGFPNSHLVIVDGATHETPTLLLDLQTSFLCGEDPRVDRLIRPFAFNPFRDA
ncbi:MAG: alpha/beta hydrolase [Gammaproteobacteria bacterium]|nr:alpha/beta hydrolase [Gammaproteobacteria bacterium]MYD81126.1 alpha/beta hydrolase [Gammaproteobacteria bacterium]